MLPTRKSSPVPRRASIIAAEIRVPSLGTAFGALASSVSADSVVLSTFQHLAQGTAVIVELSLPDGAATVDGVVASEREEQSVSVTVRLEGVDDATRARLVLAASIPPPALEARVA